MSRDSASNPLFLKKGKGGGRGPKLNNIHPIGIKFNQPQDMNHFQRPGVFVYTESCCAGRDIFMYGKLRSMRLPGERMEIFQKPGKIAVFVNRPFAVFCNFGRPFPAQNLLRGQAVNLTAIATLCYRSICGNITCSKDALISAVSRTNCNLFKFEDIRNMHALFSQ